MTHLTEGQKAPAFTGINQAGKKISLADFKGKKVVLYFYPKDHTPTCTIQACNLRDNFAVLQNAGYVIIGISPDSETSHQSFTTKNNLPFDLIADSQRIIIDKYGVWGEKKLYGKKYFGLIRTTFIINEKGVIERIILKPKSKQYAEEILKN
ncbi:MAG: peroxiredoxin [Chitinophagaceae bacterium]